MMNGGGPDRGTIKHFKHLVNISIIDYKLCIFYNEDIFSNIFSHFLDSIEKDVMKNGRKTFQ